MRVLDDRDWSAASALLEQQMLDEMNARRAAGANCGGRTFEPVGPLEMHPNLTRAARHHSLDMVERDYFDHCSLEGCEVRHRLDAAGWAGAAAGENIAAGASTAASAVQQLMDSPGHCANSMRAGFRYVGIGHASEGASGRRNHWTQVFSN